MRQLGFGLGMVLALAAAVTAVAQLLSLIAHGSYVPVSLLAIWSAFDAGVGATIEAGAGWWSLLRWPLRLPAFVPLGLGALLLLIACRPRRSSFY